jgi:hypothetical protein
MPKKLSPKTISVEERDELKRVLKAAQAKYSKYSQVLGVAVGVKYQKRQATDEVGIVFFVEKKEDMPLKKLPRYLVGRFADGRANFRKRIKTDVIQVGRVEPACRAGSDVSSFTETGTITLFFRNKVPSNPSYYIITCSHVAGDMTYSPPDDPDLGSQCCPKVYPFATTLKNSVIGPAMPYDIALAQITNKAIAYLGSALPNLDGAVLGTSVSLKGILPNGQIVLNDEVQCAMASSGPQAATVSAHGTEFPIDYRGRKVLVSDLFTLELHVEGGDSGGLVYRDQVAIGIIVAKSIEGWAWFHPLDNALTYINSLDPPLQLKIF